MSAFWVNLGIDLLSNLIWIVATLALLIFVSRFWTVSRRAKLIEFFKLDPKNPSIAVYVARHRLGTKLPTVALPVGKGNDDLAASFQKIADVQELERQMIEDNPSAFSHRPFTAVAAVEMIEYLRLRDFITRSSWVDWLPSELQSQLQWLNPKAKRISVVFDACPEELSDLAPGTIVLIGSARANLATHYYWFGEEACRVRFGRLNQDRPSAHILDGTEREFFPPTDGQDLGVIERYSYEKRTIFYLAGSGISGTAASVEYLMMNWRDIYEQMGERDFARVISCNSRVGSETPSYYAERRWQETDWLRLF